MNAFRRLIAEGARFGIVGLTATAVHVAVFLGSRAVLDIAALWANGLAFAVAVIVSFVGHFRWTFRKSGAYSRAEQAAAFSRFTVAALTGFALNSLAAYTIVDALRQPDWLAAAFMVCVTPLCVYLISKFWVFT